MKHVFFKWTSALAIGMSAIMLFGCGGVSSSQSAQNNQVCPAHYTDKENNYIYFVDNALAKEPKSYPIPADNLFTDELGHISSDGKWLYLFGEDPNQYVDTRYGIDTDCLYRFPTEKLTKDAEKNKGLMEKIDISYGVSPDASMLDYPDGSILLITDDSYREGSWSIIYHLTDTEYERVEYDISEYKILGDNTVVYNDSVLYEERETRFGVIFFDKTENQFKNLVITVKADAVIIGQDETAVYYYNSYGDTLSFYKAEYTGNTQKLGSLNKNSVGKKFDERNTRFQISNGGLDVKMCYRDFYNVDSYKHFKNIDGSFIQVAKDADNVLLENGIYLYNRQKSSDGEIYFVSSDGNETEMEGVSGTIESLTVSDDNSVMLFQADDSYFYASIENDTVKDIIELDGPVSDTYITGNTVYYKVYPNLFCVKNGEIFLAAEDVESFDDAFLLEDGCILLDCWLGGSKWRFAFYKNGERLGEPAELELGSSSHYIAENIFVYTDTEYTTYVTSLTTKGFKTINKFSCKVLYSLKLFNSEFLDTFRIR